jgi:hypothetical protein
VVNFIEPVRAGCDQEAVQLDTGRTGRPAEEEPELSKFAAGPSLLGVVFGTVLFVVVVGEWLGLFETVTSNIPWYVSLSVIILLGYPVFLNVYPLAPARVISHTC